MIAIHELRGNSQGKNQSIPWLLGCLGYDRDSQLRKRDNITSNPSFDVFQRSCFYPFFHHTDIMCLEELGKHIPSALFDKDMSLVLATLKRLNSVSARGVNI